jgi:hypothetical protein
VIAKTALFCDVEPEAVVPLETADTLYAVPLMLEEFGLGNWLMQPAWAMAGVQPASASGAPGAAWPFWLKTRRAARCAWRWWANMSSWRMPT